MLLFIKYNEVQIFLLCLTQINFLNLKPRFMKRYCLILLTSFFLISCHDEPMWFNNEYVFLEQHKSIHSELIKGYYPHLCVDFPMYIYYPETKELYGSIDGNFTDKTMMLLGMGESHSGYASSGAGTWLQEVHNLPHGDYNLSVKSINEDGTVHFTYKDSSMVLALNEEWSKLTLKMDTTIFDGYDPETDIIVYDTTIIKWTYHDRVTNWGLLEKDQFGNLEDLWGE